MAVDTSDVLTISKLLAPSVPIQVRKHALELILEASIQTSGLHLFSAENFTILDGLCELFSNSVTEVASKQTILSILVNVTAESNNLAERILSKENVVQKCIEECSQKGPCLLRSTQVMANISRHCAQRLHLLMEEQWTTYLHDIFASLLSTLNEDFIDYLGYVLMNLSSLENVRKEIATNHLLKLLPLLSEGIRLKRKVCAVNVVYNLSFDDELHALLLNRDDEDNFLCAIVAPLTDESYELDEEETSKLPLQLQYYDKNRQKDMTICQKLIETLYQLCATKVGRETLRKKGIYPLLRELDKATSKEIQSTANEAQLEFQNTLHALIGVLIRYESEMEISEDTFSIRHLQ
ncbi:protein HGH1 like protein [Ditylenchus destructor]|uniref:Protein HGH1 homolog n=1 Tax=Ditylenchus destructor TaxID=166010 RepID=A0AAD4RDV0_9BILA|nr:protein HGH1 like protein [Ditylenchus destructor]